MPKVNHEILTWARETSGLTREEAARKLALRDARGVKAVDRLAAYEAGQTDPTRPTLVKMAKYYRRPLLTFYLSTPPREGDRGADFRTVLDGHSRGRDALLDTLMRDAAVRQSMIRAVLEDEDEAETLPFVGSMEMANGRSALAIALQDLLDVDAATVHSQPDADSAFDLLRSAAENKGMFVLLKGDLGSYHTAIDTDTFRGFTISDDVAPLIVINDNDARTAWSFTLLHEMVHVLLGQSGVGNALMESTVESFCEGVAGEFLLPAAELDLLELDGPTAFDPESEERISEYARERNLSRSMVAYRAYRAGLIGYRTFTQLYDRFRSEWFRERQKRRERARLTSGGPDYYVVRRHRTGYMLIELARRMMASGALSTTQAARMLGVKPVQVGKLLHPDGAG